MPPNENPLLCSFMNKDMTPFFTQACQKSARCSDKYVEIDRKPKVAALHINFEDKISTFFTMDAKVTVPDMIGSIGGTLGVFIGK